MICSRCAGVGTIHYAHVLARAQSMHRLRDELANAKFGGAPDLHVIACAESLVPTTSERERRALASLVRDGRAARSYNYGLSAYLNRVTEWIRSLEYAGIAQG